MRAIIFLLLTFLSACAAAQREGKTQRHSEPISIEIYLIGWGVDVFGSDFSREDVVQRAEIRTRLTGIEMSTALQFIESGDWEDPGDSSEMWPIVFVADIKTGTGEITSFTSDGCFLKQLGANKLKRIDSMFRRAFALGTDDHTRRCQ